MKKFKPITDEELAKMTREEKLLAISGMHQALLEKFRKEVTAVINTAVTAAEESGRDPREVVLTLAAKDDPFFDEAAKSKFPTDYNVFWLYKEAILSSAPGADEKHPYHEHWVDAATTIDNGLKCLVIAYGAVSVISILAPQEPVKVEPTNAEIAPEVSDLDTGVDASADHVDAGQESVTSLSSN